LVDEVANDHPTDAQTGPAKQVSLTRLLLLCIEVGALAFGGGIGIMAYLEREVVHKRHILTAEEFLNGMGMSQMLGPMAVNASFFIGYRYYGFLGGLLCLFAFTGPSVLLVILLAWLYFAHHALPALQGVLAGVQPAVIALIASAAWSLGRKAVRTLPAAMLCAMGLGAGVMKVGFLYALAASGFVGLLLGSRRITGNNEPPPSAGPEPVLSDRDRPAAPLILAPATGLRQTLPGKILAAAGAVSLAKLALVGMKVGLLWVGGTFTIVALLYQNLVVEQGWITPALFRDAVAIASITPGPLSVLATFTGYYLHGIAGSLVATYSLYVPSIAMMTFLCDRYQRLPAGGRARDFLNGLSPCVVGVVLSAAVMLGNGVLNTGWLIHYRACLLTVIAFLLLVRFKWSPVYVLALAAGVGWIWPV
jgi:chromate transporter